MTTNIRTTLLIVIAIQLISITDAFSQYGWIQQNSGINSRLNSVQFLNSQTGWSAGDNGIILKTTNGGGNWLQQSTGTSFHLRCISFTSLEIGYISGDTGTILKTSNGGENWFQVNLTANTDFFSICFVNDSTGFTGGLHIDPHPSFLYKTTDGGITWDSLVVYDNNPNLPYYYIYQVYFLNPTTGWVIANHGPITWEAVNKTTNGGINWVTQYGQSSWKGMNLFFADSLYGWLSGRSQMFDVIYRTTNSGTNWIPQDFPIIVSANSMDFINRSKGWAAGKFGGIYATANGGVNWMFQFSQPGIIYRSINFIDSLTGWCVGDSGRILKTTTGGLTYINSNYHEVPGEYYLSQNYPNPFNPGTVINYSIPLDVRRQTSTVRLVIYDALGKEVSTLVNEKKNPGRYEVVFDGSNLSSGIYFYSLSDNGNIIDTKRMILLK